MTLAPTASMSVAFRLLEPALSNSTVIQDAPNLCEVPSARRVRERAANDDARLVHDGIQVRWIPKTLGIDLVKVLRAGWPGREPAVRRNYLQPTNRSVIAGGPSQLGHDRLPRQFLGHDGFGGKPLQGRLLGRGGR